MPEDVKAGNPEIPWSLIKEMRNRFIYKYGLDLQVVWNVIHHELPALENDLKMIHAVLAAEKR